MLYTLFRTKFSLNHSKKITRVLLSMYGSETEDEQFFYDKPSHTIPLKKSYNYHFDPWEQVIKDFDPESVKYWRAFAKKIQMSPYALDRLHFVNRDSCDWMPDDDFGVLAESYVVYKLIDRYGNAIDVRPYIKNFIEQEKARYKEKRRNRLHKDDPAFCFQQFELRHPHTTNELRQLPSPEDKRYLRENGYQFRIRESRIHLPNDWDDFMIDIPRCWKDRTKQRKQYNAKLRAKHKTCKGWPQLERRKKEIIWRYSFLKESTWDFRKETTHILVN